MQPHALAKQTNKKAQSQSVYLWMYVQYLGIVWYWTCCYTGTILLELHVSFVYVYTVMTDWLVY